MGQSSFYKFHRRKYGNIFALGLGLSLAVASSSPSRGDEMIVDGKPCNALCQKWMGIQPAGDHKPASGFEHRLPQPTTNMMVRVVRPSPESQPPKDVFDPQPEGRTTADPGERYEAPDINHLVAVRGGDIVVATPAEMAEKRRQRAAMLKSIERPNGLLIPQ